MPKGSSILAGILGKTARRKALVSGALTMSLLASPGVASAKDIGLAAAKRLPVKATQSAAVRASKYRNIVDTVTAMTDKNVVVREKAADFLFKTGVHESQGLTKFRQVGGGPGRGIMMTEQRSLASPDKVSTLEDVVQRYAKSRPEAMGVLEQTSGKTKKQLLSMTDVQLGDLSVKEQTFNVAVARYKLKMFKEAIPGDKSLFPDYWFKYYQGGSKSVETIRKNAYERSLRSFDKKTIDDLMSMSSAGRGVKAQKNLTIAMASQGSGGRQFKQTAGTYKVLEDKKIMHNISNQKMKTDHLFRV